MSTNTNSDLDESFEILINGLLEKGFGVCPDVLNKETIDGLRQNLLQLHQSGKMHPAGVGRKFDYMKNAEVRGDVIKWIEPDSTDVFERNFLDMVQNFIKHLNESCYTGITGYEFHYAFYDVGSFYRRHLDRFKSDKGREFSFVLYLNDDWKETDNGRLTLYLDDEEVSIYPIASQVIFFKSDQTEHEVHPSPTRPRLSIAGWLKR